MEQCSDLRLVFGSFLDISSSDNKVINPNGSVALIHPIQSAIERRKPLISVAVVPVGVINQPAPDPLRSFVHVNTLLLTIVYLSTSWVKILNPSYSQNRDRQKMFEKVRSSGERVAAARA